jgi:ABC-type transport system substrate-binding protein
MVRMIDRVFRAGAVVLALLGAPSAVVHAAEPPKTLRVVLTGGEAGLDPAVASDINTLSLAENIFDAPLRYDYLADPVRLQPNTLAAMPQVADKGATYLLRLRPGIAFAPDPAFKGRRRELTAQDYAYSFKRIYDPALKSPWLFLFEGRIAGDDVLTGAARAGRFDVDAPVPGLQAVDRYTLRIRLNAPDANFLYKLAMPAAGAVAREVIDAYPGQAGNHPVGTGPFMIGEWRRSNRIELLAHPGFRDTVFDAAPSADPAAQAIAAALRGKRLPRVQRIDVRIVEEEQARVLGLFNGEFDYLEQVPPALGGMVLDHGALRPELARQGMRLARFYPLQTYYMWMNMDDPVIGGYAPERIALRRAIALAYDRAEDLRVMEKGLALPAQSPLPPNVLGHDAAYRSPVGHDTVLANALLDRFGYGRRDAQGYRMAADGKPLALVMHSVASTAGRQRDEAWQRTFAVIGLRVVFKSDKKTEIIKASRLGKVQMFETNWIADFPDGENFLQLLYGPNAGRANYARFNLPQYDRLYEQALRLPDSPERSRLYREMTQLLHAYTPWVLRMHPVSLDLRHAWVKNYRHHPVELTAWRYVDIDAAEREGHARANPAR